VPRLYIRAAARRDLVEHAVYLAAEGGEELAERFLSQAEASCALLLDQPEIGSPLVVRDPALVGIRKWPVKDFETFLIFICPPRTRSDDCSLPLRAPRLVAIARGDVRARAAVVGGTGLEPVTSAV
jgi:toxin ParE1/3/4